MNLKEITVQIKFKERLHARPADRLAQQASAFESEILIRADGTDENEAISAMEK